MKPLSGVMLGRSPSVSDVYVWSRDEYEISINYLFKNLEQVLYRAVVMWSRHLVYEDIENL